VIKARRLGLLLAITASTALVSVASAQQPAQPQPGQPQPGQPQPGRGPGPGPGMQPGQPGALPGQPPQPGRPVVIPRQPGQQPGQPGQPRPRPQLPPGVLPPGHPPVGGAAEEHAAPHAGHCPGHGPEDPPGHINWYQGLLGINNEKAESPNALDKVLYRYKNERDECDPKNQEPPVLAMVINFLVLVGLLFRFGRKPILEGLLNRKKAIMQDIDTAQELKNDAEERLAKYEKQLGNIEARRRELTAEFQAQFEADKARLLGEAREKRTRLLKDAEFRVSQDLKTAQAELLTEAVDGAVKAAEEILGKRVEAADHERLADEFLTSVGVGLGQSTKPTAPSGGSATGGAV
jgi:F-type H+-transporting ATPase subunit b